MKNLSQIFETTFLDLDFITASDEVGRGPLAGPVVAASVFISMEKKTDSFLNYIKSLRQLGVTDSKKLSQSGRMQLLARLNIDVDALCTSKVYNHEFENQAMSFALFQVDAQEIDQLNILRASMLAMKTSMELAANTQKKNKRGYWLIDGNHKVSKFWPIKSEIQEITVIKGDQKSTLIGLASIIAKEYRDHLMKKLAKQYPGYGLEKHAGYPTKFHLAALKRLGVSPIHRKSFGPVRDELAQ